jgi:ribosome biogenesis protein UTP30
MAKDELIDDHVSLRQCGKAIKALHLHQTKKMAERQERELLPGKEENIWLVVAVKKVSTTLRLKPVRM